MIARSNPSRTRSIITSPVRKSTDVSGCPARKPATTVPIRLSRTVLSVGIPPYGESAKPHSAGRARRNGNHLGMCLAATNFPLASAHGPRPSGGGFSAAGNGVSNRRRVRTTNGSRRVSDYPIYPDSASAERRIIPVTPAPIYRATHCRIELSKSQASVKNSRLKRRAMTPKLTYAHILGLET
jgi:hypothetical protein